MDPDSDWDDLILHGVGDAPPDPAKAGPIRRWSRGAGSSGWPVKAAAYGSCSPRPTHPVGHVLVVGSNTHHYRDLLASVPSLANSVLDVTTPLRRRDREPLLGDTGFDPPCAARITAMTAFAHWSLQPWRFSSGPTWWSCSVAAAATGLSSYGGRPLLSRGRAYGVRVLPHPSPRASPVLCSCTCWLVGSALTPSAAPPCPSLSST